MQGIRKDHVEFQYSASNRAKGLKGDHSVLTCCP